MNRNSKTPENPRLRTDLLPDRGESWIHVAEKVGKSIKRALAREGYYITSELFWPGTILAFLGSYIETDEETPKRKAQLPDGAIEQIKDLLIVTRQIPENQKAELNALLEIIFLKRETHK